MLGSCISARTTTAAAEADTCTLTPAAAEYLEDARGRVAIISVDESPHNHSIPGQANQIT